VFAGAVFGQTPTLETLARNYRKSQTDPFRASLQRFATTHAKDAQGARALFALGAIDYERKRYADAITNLQAASKRIPKLADYSAYLEASAQSESGNFEACVKALDPVWTATPDSPLLARSAMLAATANLQLKRPKEALERLRKYYAELPQPQGDLLVAQSSEAVGDPVAAVSYYQRVYYQKPSSAEAAEAETALTRLHQELGERFPPAMPQMMLERAFRLLNASDPARAKKELQTVIPQVGGDARDLAKVRIGVADYTARLNREALAYLKDVKVQSGEADAERLYYMHSAARRLKNDADAQSALTQLAKYHADSPWRLQAVVSAGNDALTRNDTAASNPFFRVCFEAFPKDPQAAYCQWKVTWDEYLHRSATADGMLRAHLRNFPESEKAAAALYFLGRLAEKQQDKGSAKAYYAELAERFPNFFHAVLARQKLKDATIAGATPTNTALDFLNSLRFPERGLKQSFEGSPATKVRIERARMLEGVGLDDWAETELRFGAKKDGQAHILGMELAQMAQSRGAYDQAIRYIKSLASGYLSIPFDAAPEKFWKLAFPMPYKAELEANCKLRGLDPYLVAALIRQESEFNPLALSRAKAHGLTQVMPSTGKELSRKLGLSRFNANMLFQPDINLKLGTYYLRMLLDQLGGQWEPTLASYNGGKSRVMRWLDNAVYEEPAEFIESIPITETRNYVQIVLRNADVYRRLYGGKSSGTLDKWAHK
jgi:soluble lytic murein transglycosylase